MHENTFIISTFFIRPLVCIIFVYTVGKIILWLYVVIVHTLENNLKMRPREENIT